jgi:hypothetical protein
MAHFRFGFMKVAGTTTQEFLKAFIWPFSLPARKANITMTTFGIDID